MPAKSKAKTQTAAIITVYGAPKMSYAGRRRVASWMRRQAEFLLKHGRELTPTRYTAKYLY